MSDRPVPHEAFLHELYVLCQNYGVHLDGTEDDGVMVVPNDVDMDLGDDDGLVHPERFAFFRCDGDGAMRCHPGKSNGRGDVDPDYDADALRLPRGS